MQVVMCEAYGGSESLVVKSVPSPTPGPGEVKVRLRARGVSFTDVLRIAGQYHVKTPPPFIPGGEAAGEIVELGADVAGLKVGDRVLLRRRLRRGDRAAGGQRHQAPCHGQL